MYALLPLKAFKHHANIRLALGFIFDNAITLSIKENLRKINFTSSMEDSSKRNIMWLLVETTTLY